MSILRTMQDVAVLDHDGGVRQKNAQNQRDADRPDQVVTSSDLHV